jgi:hypothetical protein
MLHRILWPRLRGRPSDLNDNYDCPALRDRLLLQLRYQYLVSRLEQLRSLFLRRPNWNSESCLCRWLKYPGNALWSPDVLDNYHNDYDDYHNDYDDYDDYDDYYDHVASLCE